MYTIKSLGVVSAIAAIAAIVSMAPAMAASAPRSGDPVEISKPGLHPPLTDELMLRGQGSLSWLGMRIYDAALWSEAGALDAGDFDGRVALRIDYHRSVTTERLVATTRREWRRLSDLPGVPDSARAEAWLTAVSSIWPDVGPGDFILTVVEPGGASSFYGPRGLLGVVDDPAFGPAFLSIWLHPDTSRPELRTALLGDPASGG